MSGFRCQSRAGVAEEIADRGFERKGGAKRCVAMRCAKLFPKAPARRRAARVPTAPSRRLLKKARKRGGGPGLVWIRCTRRPPPPREEKGGRFCANETLIPWLYLRARSPPPWAVVRTGQCCAKASPIETEPSPCFPFQPPTSSFQLPTRNTAGAGSHGGRRLPPLSQVLRYAPARH